MNDPVFLMSSERSGSNLLRAMLGSHSRLAAPAPAHLLKTFLPILAFYGDLRQEPGFSAIVRDVAQALRAQLGVWQSDVSASQLEQTSKGNTFFDVVASAYRMECDALGKVRAVIKDHGVLGNACCLSVHYPESRFIYLVRDPRDVALSWRQSKSHFGGCLASARRWVSDQRKALQDYALLHCTGRIRLVWYEDLIRNPEGELAALCEFLGEPFEKGLLQFQTAQRKNSSRTENWRNLERGVMRSNTGKFVYGLTGRQQGQIEKVAFTEMITLGYQPIRDYSKGRRYTVGDTGKILRNGWQLVRLLLGGPKLRSEAKRRLRRLQRLNAVEKRVRSNPAEWRC